MKESETELNLILQPIEYGVLLDCICKDIAWCEYKIETLTHIQDRGKITKSQEKELQESMARQMALGELVKKFNIQDPEVWDKIIVRHSEEIIKLYKKRNFRDN